MATNEETLSTLRFAANVKKIKTVARQNVDKKDEIASSLGAELKQLKALAKNDDPQKHTHAMLKGFMKIVYSWVIFIYVYVYIYNIDVELTGFQRYRKTNVRITTLADICKCIYVRVLRCMYICTVLYMPV